MTFKIFLRKCKSLLLIIKRKYIRLFLIVLRQSPEFLLKKILLKQQPVWNMRKDQGMLNILSPDEMITIQKAPYWGKNDLTMQDSCRVPMQWHAILENAQVHSPSFAVTTRNILWQQEEVTELPAFSSGYSIDIFEKNKKYFLLSQFIWWRKVKEAALLAHRTGFSYFHALFEGLPKISLLQKMDPDNKIPVILSGTLNPNLKDIMEKLLGNRRIIYLRSLERLKIKKLHFFSVPSYLPDDVKFGFNNAAISRLYINRTREMLAAKNEDSETIELLWISREHYAEEHKKKGVAIRDIENFKEIEEIMRQYPLTIYQPEKHHWTEQRKVFAAAKRIVMVSGSAISNMMYCKPGTRALLMCKNKGVNPGLFFPIFEELQIAHGWVLGQGDSTNPHEKFWVNPNDFTRGLQWLYGEDIKPDGFIPS